MDTKASDGPGNDSLAEGRTRVVHQSLVHTKKVAAQIENTMTQAQTTTYDIVCKARKSRSGTVDSWGKMNLIKVL